MTPEQYRQRKDQLLADERLARERAQNAATAVTDAKECGAAEDVEAAERAYRAAIMELEDLEHQTGEYD